MVQTYKLSDEKLQKKIGWRPFEGQRQIIEAFNSKRDIVVAAGVRFGKTTTCAYIALRELFKTDKHVWIIAPTYELSEMIFNKIVEWLVGTWPQTSSWISRRPLPEIRNPYTGSFIKCKSAENPVGLLGEELDLAIMDEAARMKNGKEIWEGYVYSRLVSRRGKSIKISTPFGQNWFYYEWLRCKEAEDGAAFRFRSIDGISVTQEEWERAKKLLPERVFLQDYEATFLPEAASVFRNIDNVVADTLKDAEPGHMYVVGVDLAKSEDFSVIIVIDRNTHDVVYFDRFKGIEFSLQKQRIIAVAKRYNNARVVVDATGMGYPIMEDLRREGLIVDDFTIYTNQRTSSKKDLIEKLSIFIEQGYIRIPNIEVLLDELRAFSYRLTPAGNVKYSAPEGFHDDCVIALALAVWPLTAKKMVVDPIKQELSKIKRSNRKYDYD